MKKGIFSFPKRYPLKDKLHLYFPVVSDGDVSQISRVVAFGIFQPVFLPKGIEMPSGRLEIGPDTLPNGMDVKAVKARRYLGKFEFDGHSPLFHLFQNRLPDFFLLDIVQNGIGLQTRLFR